MFTGIIEGIGKVKSVEKQGASGRMTVEAPALPEDLRLGDSVSVNGACLTVTGFSGNAFSADLSVETMEVTTLGSLKKNEPVNIEWALTLSKPLGGHLVTGHVDAIGAIEGISPAGEAVDVSISAPAGIISQLVRKGSVAIDGISLTVAEIGDGFFRIAVIPHTLQRTNLSTRKAGDRVNIETDLIGKYVEKFVSRKEKKEISEDFLAEHGFFKR